MKKKRSKKKKEVFFVFFPSIGLSHVWGFFFQTDMYHEALCQLCFFQIDFPMGTF